MQAAKRIAKNTGILYVRMGITVFISLYSMRLIIGALGADDFGIFNVIAGAVVMLTFLNSAMAAATQRYMSFAQGAGDGLMLKKIFNVSIVLHLVIATLVFILLEGVGYFLFDGVLNIQESRIEAAKLIFQFSIVSTLFTIISVPYDAVINSHENMLLYAVIGVLEAVLKLSIALYITYTSYDKLVTYGLLTAMLSILLLTINRVYCHKYYAECTINLSKYFDKPLFKDMASFGGWSFLGSMAGMISNYGQGIVINMFFGTAVNAAQGIANQISGQIGAFSGTMLKALNPFIVKSEGGGQRSLMIQSTMTGCKFSYFLLSIIAIPAIIDMPYILSIWLKNVPDYAVVFCRLLLIKNLIEQLFITLSVSISAVGKIRNYQISVSLLAAFPLIVTYILFYLGYPPYIMYLVFIIQCTMRSFGITLYFANKNSGLPIFLFLKNVVFRSIVVSIIAAMFGLMLMSILEQGILRLTLLFMMSGIIFLIAVNWIGLVKEERDQIKLLVYHLVGKLREKSLQKYLVK